jgi:ELWxxDGT repeat protein
MMLLGSVCSSQTTRLVKDINQRLTPTPSNPRPSAGATDVDHAQFVTVLDTTYFVATHPRYGTELFQTKGTAASTTLAMDIEPGLRGSDPRDFMTDGYRLFFSAFDGMHGRELWVAEPLFRRVRRVADINPALTEGSNPTHITHFNGVILFQASSYGTNTELWRTDGTAKNTVLVKELRPGIDYGSSPQNFTTFNRKAYFQAYNGNAFNLYQTDGTTKGTKQVGSQGVSFERGDAVVFRGELYFTGRSPREGLELWKINAVSQSPELVHDVFRGPASGGADELTVFGKDLYFVAEGVKSLPYSRTGVELWKTDGETLTLIELHDGARGSFPRMLRVFGTGAKQALYFTAKGTAPGRTESVGEELWRIGGNGITLFDIELGEDGSAPRGLMQGPGGYLYFSAATQGKGRELWRTDGSLRGTGLFKAMQTYGFPWGSRPSFMTKHRIAGMIFTCDDGPHGTELWQSDGTVTGTRLLVDLNPKTTATRGSSPALRAVVAGSVYFTAQANYRDPVMWMSDGTSAGTFEVPGLKKSSVFGVREVCAVGGTAYLVGVGKDVRGRDVGFELWALDHRTSQLTLIDVRVGLQGSLPLHLTEFRGQVFFSAIGDLNQTGLPKGRELWCSDGTPAGTRMVADISPGRVNSEALSSDPDQMFRFRDRLYFAARDRDHGLELWVTDGSTKGTKLLMDFNPGMSDSHPHGFARLGDRFVFVASGSATGTEMYVSDGTVKGTTRIDIRSGSASGFPKWHTRPDQVFAVAGGVVYFAAQGDLNQNSIDSGLELWRSDGTAKGTRLVADLWRGTGGSDPGSIVRLGETGSVVFIATTGAGRSSTGPAIWVSDGTAKRTTLLRRIHPGWLGHDTTKSGGVGSGRSYLQLPIYLPNTNEFRSQVFVTDGTVFGTNQVINDQYSTNRAGAPPDAMVTPSGRIFLSRVHPKYGSELWVLEGLATATPIGRGCSPRLDPPSLSSNDPVLGGLVRPRVQGVARSLGVLMVGMWQSSPYSLGPDCEFHVDFLGHQVMLPFVTGSTGVWEGALRTTNAYESFQYAIQACVSESASGGAVGFSNGVVLTPGKR